jgi:hypothetical protein
VLLVLPRAKIVLVATVFNRLVVHDGSISAACTALSLMWLRCFIAAASAASASAAAAAAAAAECRA